LLFFCGLSAYGFLKLMALLVSQTGRYAAGVARVPWRPGIPEIT
jgi:hypothetical protein